MDNLQKSLNIIYTNLKTRCKATNQQNPFNSFDEFYKFALSKNFKVGQSLRIRERSTGYVKNNLYFCVIDKKIRNTKKSQAIKTKLANKKDLSFQESSFLTAEIAEKIYTDALESIKTDIIAELSKILKKDLKHGSLRRDYTAETIEILQNL
jgi:hypothetical protein